MPSSVLERVGTLLGEARRDPSAARAGFMALWDEVGSDGDPLHRCAIAHSAADTEDSAEGSLVWNLRALEATAGLTDAHLEAAGMAGTARGMLPSLHLNLAEDYLRLGRASECEQHLALAHAHLDALPEDGYRGMIRDALDRITLSVRSATPV